MTKQEADELKREQEMLVDKIVDVIVENFLHEYDAYDDMPLDQMVCEKADILDVFKEESEGVAVNRRDFCGSSKAMQALCSQAMLSPEFLRTKATDTNRIGLGSIERFLRSRGFNQKQIKSAKKEIRLCLESNS
jgi:hypothetical protein